MGKDYQHGKKYYFCLSFLSKTRTSGRLILIKKPLLKPIFRQVEMSFRNTLCLANVAMSCRDKLLMQNLIPANVNLKVQSCKFKKH